MDGLLLNMSINVSPRQLTSSEFVEDLRQALRAADLPADRITIEVTEGALMKERSVEQLQLVRAIGCRIAIDDFGTGYSSLSYLRHLPIDYLKIDRSFVRPLGHDPKADRFFVTLVSLAHTLDLAVVAEGIETEEQRVIVRDARCDTAQGYLFSRPVSTEDARRMVAGAASG
ncbi:EAL domain-containing protein [Methylobacterium iners]|uniref:Signaling protein n=1 Tax=Methylobacterium iners TaxID=418707 RepID=A0ABQ4RTF0_9HYPH|nr:EAL domain-containing protein [Methylobacterium iners]GJD93484.1 putative signaling protein [Methylobacterium iners]